MKKVLSVILTPTFGGPHNQMLRLFYPLKELGYEYLVVTPDKEGSGTKRLEELNIPVKNISLSRPRKTISFKTHSDYLRNFWSEVNEIRALIRDENIDVVQLCGLFNLQGAIAARLEKKPVVWQLLSNFAPKWLRYLLSPIVVGFSHSIMTTGKLIANEHMGMVNSPKLVPFYPPVETDNFIRDLKRRAEVREKLGVSENEILIGTVGNQNRQKAHSNLVHIAKLLESERDTLKFRIIGRHTESQAGYYKKAVFEKIEQLGFDKDGYLTVNEPELPISDYLSAFDIFLITSIAEGVPTVILESMSTGLPIISSDVGAISEIVEQPENGFLYKKNNNEEAVKCIKYYLEDVDRIKETEEINRIKSKNEYDVGKCAETHIQAFELALKK